VLVSLIPIVWGYIANRKKLKALES
jgi:hypothetical protein